MLLKMSIVSEDFPAECARDFIYNVSVAEVILEYALRWIIFVADIAIEDFSDFCVLQLDVSSAVSKI